MLSGWTLNAETSIAEGCEADGAAAASVPLLEQPADDINKSKIGNNRQDEILPFIATCLIDEHKKLPQTNPAFYACAIIKYISSLRIWGCFERDGSGFSVQGSSLKHTSPNDRFYASLGALRARAGLFRKKYSHRFLGFSKYKPINFGEICEIRGVFYFHVSAPKYPHLPS
jgi:hypothetical protein